jgi:hypothetical protein
MARHSPSDSTRRKSAEGLLHARPGCEKHAAGLVAFLGVCSLTGWSVVVPLRAIFRPATKPGKRFRCRPVSLLSVEDSPRRVFIDLVIIERGPKLLLGLLLGRLLGGLLLGGLLGGCH